MPYLLTPMHGMSDSQRCAVAGFEPPMEAKVGSPKILLMLGRGVMGHPDDIDQLTAEERSNIPHTVLIDFVPRGGGPDFNGMHGSPIFSQRVKDKLEELEPGVHEFFPVTLKHRKTGKEYGTYFLTFINQRPDIIDHDRTLYGAGENFGTGGEMGQSVNFNFRQLIKKKPRNISGPPLINFKEPGYAGRHLWRGTSGTDWMRRSIVEVEGPHKGKVLYDDQMWSVMFCSDAFGDWIRAEKVRGSKPIKIIEKPPEWYYEQREKGNYH
ncbi:MAG: DUF1629 domain-containing protein [Pseudomonadota bacterium]